MVRPLEAGDMRGTILTFFSGSVGAGILSYPRIMSFFGMGMSLGLTATAAILALISFEILIQAADRCKKNSYANIVKHYLGRNAAKFLTFGIIICQFLLSNIYLCIAWDFFKILILKFDLIELDAILDKKSGEYEVEVYNPKVMFARGMFLLGFMLLL